MIITRDHHAFEGQSLAVISSMRRRGVLLVLVVLPDGSRSLIPASSTDWRPEQARQTPTEDASDGAHDLGRLGDLLHLRKIIDALYSRHIESSPCKESSHAIELSFLDQSDLPVSPSPASPSPNWDQLDKASRIAALEILVRLIARMLAPEAVKGASDE